MDISKTKWKSLYLSRISLCIIRNVYFPTASFKWHKSDGFICVGGGKTLESESFWCSRLPNCFFRISLNCSSGKTYSESVRSSKNSAKASQILLSKIVTKEIFFWSTTWMIFSALLSRSSMCKELGKLKWWLSKCFSPPRSKLDIQWFNERILSVLSNGGKIRLLVPLAMPFSQKHLSPASVLNAILLEWYSVSRNSL